MLTIPHLNKGMTRERLGPIKDKGSVFFESGNVGEVLNQYVATVFTKKTDVKDNDIMVGVF